MPHQLAEQLPVGDEDLGVGVDVDRHTVPGVADTQVVEDVIHHVAQDDGLKTDERLIGRAVHHGADGVDQVGQTASGVHQASEERLALTGHHPVNLERPGDPGDHRQRRSELVRDGRDDRSLPDREIPLLFGQTELALPVGDDPIDQPRGHDTTNAKPARARSRPAVAVPTPRRPPAESAPRGASRPRKRPALRRSGSAPRPTGRTGRTRSWRPDASRTSQ